MASRPGFNLWHKAGWRNLYFFIYCRKHLPLRLMYEDTVRPIICKFFGHIEYNAGFHGNYIPACKRCYQFLKNK